LQNCNIAQAVSAGALGDQLRRRVKSLRAALAVKARDTFEVALGGFTGEFLGKCGGVFFREERRFLRDSGERSQQKREDE